MNTPFIFTEEDRSPYATVARYKEANLVRGKLRQLRMENQVDHKYFALYYKLVELSHLCDYVKVPEPEDHGITQEQVDEFLRTDRYVTAILLLKKLEEEKNKQINEFRKKIISEYNQKKEKLKIFTKNMMIRYEDENRKK